MRNQGASSSSIALSAAREASPVPLPRPPQALPAGDAAKVPAVERIAAPASGDRLFVSSFDYVGGITRYVVRAQVKRLG